MTTVAHHMRHCRYGPYDVLVVCSHSRNFYRMLLLMCFTQKMTTVAHSMRHCRYGPHDVLVVCSHS